MAKNINEATELKDIKVGFISLVHKGANGKKLIWKSDEASADGSEEHTIQLRDIRKNEEKRMVYGVVYSPNQVDSQGEFAKAEEIEAAAHDFMKSRNTNKVDANHDFDPKAAFVAESWIIKGVDTLFEKEPEGTWCVGIKVDDDGLWERVKKGELEGISMAGHAVKIKKSEGSGILADLAEALKKLLKSEDSGEKKTKVDETVGVTLSKEEAEALLKAMSSVEKFTTENKKLAERVEALEKSTPGKQSGSVGDGKPGDDDFAGLV